MILVNELEWLLQFGDLLSTAGVSPDDGLADCGGLGPLGVLSLFEDDVRYVRTVRTILRWGDTEGLPGHQQTFKAFIL